MDGHQSYHALQVSKGIPAVWQPLRSREIKSGLKWSELERLISTWCQAPIAITIYHTVILAGVYSCLPIAEFFWNLEYPSEHNTVLDLLDLLSRFKRPNILIS